MSMKRDTDSLLFLCKKSNNESGYIKGKVYKAVAFDSRNNDGKIEYSDFQILMECKLLWLNVDDYLTEGKDYLFEEVKSLEIEKTFQLGIDTVHLFKLETDTMTQYNVKKKSDTFFGTFSCQSSYEDKDEAVGFFDQICKELQEEYKKIDDELEK